MSTQIKIPDSVLSGSFLIGVLYLVRILSLYEEIVRLGRPYVYSTVLMVQLSIIKSWMRCPSNNTFHYYLSIKYADDKLLKVCKLQQIPDRRTLDRRLSCLPLSELVNAMGNLFILENLVETNSASVDSTMLKAKCPVHHKSDNEKGRLPIPGIDIDAQWGFPMQKVGFMDTSFT